MFEFYTCDQDQNLQPCLTQLSVSSNPACTAAAAMVSMVTRLQGVSRHSMRHQHVAQEYARTCRQEPPSSPQSAQGSDKSAASLRLPEPQPGRLQRAQTGQHGPAPRPSRLDAPEKAQAGHGCPAPRLCRLTTHVHQLTGQQRAHWVTERADCCCCCLGEGPGCEVQPQVSGGCSDRWLGGSAGADRPARKRVREGVSQCSSIASRMLHCCGP